MKVATFSLGLILLIGVPALFAAQRDRQLPRGDRPGLERRETRTWRRVTTFTGSGPRQTPVFKVKGKRWRLRWSVDGHMNKASLSLTVFDRKNHLPPPAEIQGLSAFDRGRTTIDRAGSFYMVVSANEAHWKLIVEELR